MRSRRARLFSYLLMFCCYSAQPNLVKRVTPAQRDPPLTASTENPNQDDVLSNFGAFARVALKNVFDRILSPSSNVQQGYGGPYPYQTGPINAANPNPGWRPTDDSGGALLNGLVQLLPNQLTGARSLNCPRCQGFGDRKLSGSWRLIYASDSFIKSHIDAIMKMSTKYDLNNDSSMRQQPTASSANNLGKTVHEMLTPVRLPVCVKLQIGEPSTAATSTSAATNYQMQYAFRSGTVQGTLNIGYGFIQNAESEGASFTLYLDGGRYPMKFCLLSSNFNDQSIFNGSQTPTTGAFQSSTLEPVANVSASPSLSPVSLSASTSTAAALAPTSQSHLVTKESQPVELGTIGIRTVGTEEIEVFTEAIGSSTEAPERSAEETRSSHTERPATSTQETGGFTGVGRVSTSEATEDSTQETKLLAEVTKAPSQETKAPTASSTSTEHNVSTSAQSTTASHGNSIASTSTEAVHSTVSSEGLNSTAAKASPDAAHTEEAPIALSTSAGCNDSASARAVTAPHGNGITPVSTEVVKSSVSSGGLNSTGAGPSHEAPSTSASEVEEEALNSTTAAQESSTTAERQPRAGITSAEADRHNFAAAAKEQPEEDEFSTVGRLATNDSAERTITASAHQSTLASASNVTMAQGNSAAHTALGASSSAPTAFEHVSAPSTANSASEHPTANSSCVHSVATTTSVNSSISSANHSATNASANLSTSAESPDALVSAVRIQRKLQDRAPKPETIVRRIPRFAKKKSAPELRSPSSQYMILSETSGLSSCQNFLVFTNDEQLYFQQHDSNVVQQLRLLSADTDVNPLQYIGCPYF